MKEEGYEEDDEDENEDEDVEGNEKAKREEYLDEEAEEGEDEEEEDEEEEGEEGRGEEEGEYIPLANVAQAMPYRLDGMPDIQKLQEMFVHRISWFSPNLCYLK